MHVHILVILWFQVKKLAKQERVFCKAYSKTKNFKGQILSTWDMAYFVENWWIYHHQRQNLNSSRYYWFHVKFSKFVTNGNGSCYFLKIFMSILKKKLYEYFNFTSFFLNFFLRNLLLHYYMQLLTLAATKMIVL